MTHTLINRLIGGAILVLALTGCKRGEENGANGSTGSTAPATTGAVTAPVKVKGKTGTAAPAKMTVSQALGVNILKALNATPGMKGHQVSVGTTSDTVILNGKVKSAAQKKTAETITRQKAKTAKVINQIEISAK